MIYRSEKNEKQPPSTTENRAVEYEKLNPVELEKTLNTMVILVDSREHQTKEAIKRWESFGVPYERSCLKSGDYSAKFTLPDGSVFDMRDKVVIERKMSLTEICGNFCQNRDRFIREFERLKEADTKCYIVIEGANWEKAYNGAYRSQMNPKSLIASLTAWMARYNAHIIFCRPETTPKFIREILYREAKELL